VVRSGCLSVQISGESHAKFFILLAGLACLPDVVMAHDLTIPADKEMIRFETNMGTVTLLHKMHADIKVTE